MGLFSRLDMSNLGQAASVPNFGTALAPSSVMPSLNRVTLPSVPDDNPWNIDGRALMQMGGGMMNAQKPFMETGAAPQRIDPYRFAQQQRGMGPMSNADMMSLMRPQRGRF